MLSRIAPAECIHFAPYRGFKLRLCFKGVESKKAAFRLLLAVEMATCWRVNLPTLKSAATFFPLPIASWQRSVTASRLNLVLSKALSLARRHTSRGRGGW